MPSNIPGRNFIHRWARKIKAIKYKNGKCSQCNIDLVNRPWLADFHHTNPMDKTFYTSELITMKDWDAIKAEIDKCILLCSNCHRTIHMNKVSFENNFKEIMSLTDDERLEYMAQRKATKKEKQRAKELMEQGFSPQQIADMLKFSASTVRIWCPQNYRFDFQKRENEVIDLYNKGLTYTEICNTLHCTFRKLKNNILKLIRLKKIKPREPYYRNQYTKNPRKVIIDGTTFLSIADASRKLGIRFTTIRARIVNPKFENYTFA